MEGKWVYMIHWGNSGSTWIFPSLLYTMQLNKICSGFMYNTACKHIDMNLPKILFSLSKLK